MEELFPLDLPPRYEEAKGASLAALVLVDGASNLEFDYAIPPELENKVERGSRVRIPIRERIATGTVLSVHPREAAQVKRLRPLKSLIDSRPILTPKLLELGRWISEYYIASMEAVVRAMLPEAVRTNLHKPQEVKMVSLCRPITAEERATLEKKARKQLEVIQTLESASEAIPQASLDGAAVRALAKKGLVKVEDHVVDRDPFDEEEFIATKPLALNSEQAAALDGILHAVEAEDRMPILLYGVTGSGKTEVYLQAAQRVLDAGKTVLVLVPEISLTPQTVDRFKSRFAHMQKLVAVLHSGLSQGERFDEWHKIARGQSRIVVGARSAVFAPLENLGLILVDEEHENSYKQDQPPRYQGRDVAVMRAKIERCAIVLGSATPSLESFYNTQRGKYQLLRLMRRADECKLPIVRVIDMKLEGGKGRNKAAPAILSERLRMAIDKRLAEREQVILFLNRRGYARSIVCNACGHVMKCAHCSVSLTLHQQDDVLICHICGYRRKPPRKCVACGEFGIFLAGYGTERVEETLRRVFPTAKLARVDTDSMQQRHRLRDTLRDFKSRKLDILLGTQMIAKGLHFPNVTLVGILNADLTLHIPDFRAGERTFQLLTQVAGRAGRGEIHGEVIVQTFTPHHAAVQFSRQHDFDGFAAQELQMRREFGHPPFGHAVLLTVRSEHKELAEFTMNTLAEKIAQALPAGILMADPAPSPLERSHNQWRFQVLFRAKSAMVITKHIVPIIQREKKGREAIVTIDVDPSDLM